MKKIIIIANNDRFHENFHLPLIEYLSHSGYTVDLASNGTSTFQACNYKFNISFARKPFKMQNIKAFFEIKKVFRDNYYDLIFCNTPIPSAIARIASIATKKKGSKIIYSSHGFNFYKGGNLFNNVLYFLIEKTLSRITDCIVTMNREDYEACRKYHFKSKIFKVHGVGIRTNDFLPADINIKANLRKKYGFSESDFILIYPAELSARKNQKTLIDIICKIKSLLPNARLLLVGTGSLYSYYESLIRKKKLEKEVLLLGFRNDIADLLKISDILVASSRTEGLPICIIEGMSTGLPIIATRAKGHVDLVTNNVNGFIFDDISSAKTYIYRLSQDKRLYDSMSTASLEKSIDYDFENVKLEYKKLINEISNDAKPTAL